MPTGLRVESKADVILPVIPILAHRGLFGMVENGWKFIWVAAIMIITICFIIGGNYSWKHTIKENIYKACKDWGVAFMHGVSAAFTLSICF